MKISIVIPAYKEESRIGRVISSFKKSKLPVIVVDDGSPDNTYEVACKNRVCVIKHSVNLGKGAAMKTGAEAAFKMGADAVVFVDGDGQHDIKDLFLFVNKLKEGNKLVIGIRNFMANAPLVRFLGNKIASFIVAVFFGKYCSDILCGYRAMTKSAYRKIIWETSGYGVETEMIVNAVINKIHFCEVPVSTIYYDKVKGVTMFDSLLIFINLLKWRITK